MCFIKLLLDIIVYSFFFSFFFYCVFYSIFIYGALDQTNFPVCVKKVDLNLNLTKR